MRAALCKKFGTPPTLMVDNIDAPALGKGEVRIEVHACGVNFADVLIVQGKYQLKPPLPFVPGGEVAGVITEVAPGVTNVELGQLLGFDTEADDSGKTSYVSNYGELGIPEDLIEATNSLVRWRYEEIRERRIGRFSVSGDRESSSFDFSNIPSYITQMIAPYQLRRI